MIMMLNNYAVQILCKMNSKNHSFTHFRNTAINTITALLFLCAPLPIHAQNEVLAIDTLSFRYVFMEFRKSYEMMDESKRMFWQECQNQNLQDVISGQMLTMFLNDREPLWRLAFPVKGADTVQEPLHLDEITNWQVVGKEYYGTDIRSAVALLNYRLREMGMHQSNCNMVRWYKPSPKIDILIPVQNLDSFDNILGKTSRFIIVFSLALYLLLAVFFIIHMNGNRLRNILFALFLFSCAMLYFDWIIGYFPYSVFTHFPHIIYIGEAFKFIVAPILFFYVLSVLQRNFRFKKWYFLHAIPSLTVMSLLTVRFYIHSADSKRAIVLSGNLFSDFEELIGTIILNTQIIGYLITAIIIVYLYKKDMKHYQSTVLPRKLSWLNIVLYGFLIMNYLGFLKHYVYRFLGIYSHVLFMSQIVSYLIFPLILFYYGLNHPELFSLIDFKVLKPQNPSLSEKVFNEYKTILTRYMNEKKPYLIPDITITKLSELVEIPVRSLSEVINKGFNQNFFEFINAYRIREAQKLMAGSHKEKTILEVIYELGYNNKSVFNSVFKKYTGKTPKEYKAELLN